MSDTISELHWCDQSALEYGVQVVEDEADRLSAMEPFVHVPSGSPFGKRQVSNFVMV